MALGAGVEAGAAVAVCAGGCVESASVVSVGVEVEADVASGTRVEVGTGVLVGAGTSVALAVGVLIVFVEVSVACPRLGSEVLVSEGETDSPPQAIAARAIIAIAASGVITLISL